MEAEIPESVAPQLELPGSGAGRELTTGTDFPGFLGTLFCPGRSPEQRCSDDGLAPGAHQVHLAFVLHIFGLVERFDDQQARRPGGVCCHLQRPLQVYASRCGAASGRGHRAGCGPKRTAAARLVRREAGPGWLRTAACRTSSAAAVNDAGCRSGLHMRAARQPTGPPNLLPFKLPTCVHSLHWRQLLAQQCVRVQALALAIAQKSELPTLMTKYDRAPERTLAQNDCASLASIVLRRGDVVVGVCNAR